MEVEQLEAKIKELQSKISLYELNGAAKLFFALNRKANEMADMLNRSNLINLDLTDPKDKTFERLKVVWNDAASLSSAIKELGVLSGITGLDEEKEVKTILKKPYTPEMAADEIGELAGQK